MLIRFKNSNDCAIYNIENIKALRVECYEMADKKTIDIVISGNANECHCWHCSTREQAIKALDKIYTAYEDGLITVTLEMD